MESVKINVVCVPPCFGDDTYHQKQEQEIAEMPNEEIVEGIEKELIKRRGVCYLQNFLSQKREVLMKNLLFLKSASYDVFERI